MKEKLTFTVLSYQESLSVEAVSSVIPESYKRGREQTAVIQEMDTGFTVMANSASSYTILRIMQAFFLLLLSQRRASIKGAQMKACISMGRAEDVPAAFN